MKLVTLFTVPIGQLVTSLFLFLLGDSGGPLACQRSDSCSWYLAGVTSFGWSCGRARFYGVYANVVNFEFWIRRTLGNDAPKSCE